jgi:hypothetical protein
MWQSGSYRKKGEKRMHILWYSNVDQGS